MQRKPSLITKIFPITLTLLAVSWAWTSTPLELLLTQSDNSGAEVSSPRNLEPAYFPGNAFCTCTSCSSYMLRNENVCTQDTYPKLKTDCTNPVFENIYPSINYHVLFYNCS